jgi:trigger factor
MQVSIETTTGLERRMTIGVPAAEIENAVAARLAEAARTVRINGFRKGKIPPGVIKSRFGKGVRQEVLGDVMSRAYYAAVNEQKIKPAGQPRIEPKSLDEGRDLEFVATFEVYPEVSLADFAAVKAEKLIADVTDKDIDTMIENLRQQRQTWEEVKRQAKNGDLVSLDFTGTIDGEEFPGGSGKGTNLVLGSDRMIPGFEKGLLKSKAGDEVTLELNFPDDYRNKDVAGKAVIFKVAVIKISATSLPQLNDEFFAAFGVAEGGLDGFRKEVASNMERELRKASKNRLKTSVMEKLLEQNQLDLPKALVAAEVNVLRQQALQQFGAGAKNLDPSMLPDELFREQAEKRVKLGLILGEVIKQRGMRAEAAKVREAIEDIAATYESPDEVISWYYSNKDQLDAVESAVLEDQVFEVIFEQAALTERTVSYEELTRPKAPGADGEESADKEKKASKKKSSKKAAESADDTSEGAAD